MRSSSAITDLEGRERRIVDRKEFRAQGARVWKSERGPSISSLLSIGLKALKLMRTSL